MNASCTAPAGSSLKTAVANKCGLATRYAVGIRTIENWLALGIIAGWMEGGEIVADVADCDARLMNYRNSRLQSKE
jgi:hypothetical protein